MQLQFIQHNYYWILPLFLIDAVLKSMALWKSARNNQLPWFVALLVLNTAGIVPLLYLLYFQRNRK